VPRNRYDIDLSTLKQYDNAHASSAANVSHSNEQITINTNCCDDGIYSGANSERWFNGTVKIELRAKTDGGIRLFYHYDYIKTLAEDTSYELCSPVRSNGMFGSTVTVESLRVTEL